MIFVNCILYFCGMHKNNRQLESIELNIESVAGEGKGLARKDNFVFFIDKGIPGDKVMARIQKKKKDYALAKIETVLEPSPDRVTPFCSHFGICGGCSWQHVAYPKQLEYKTFMVREAFRRIGKMELTEISPILGSEATSGYRNKIEYTFSNRGWLTDEQIKSGQIFERRALGFHIPERFEHILHINKCYLQEDQSNTIRLAVYDFAIRNNMEFYNLKFHEGLLRNLIIRNTTLQEWMVTVCFAKEDDKNILLMNFLKENFSFITSLNYLINNKKNDTIYDREVIHFSGKDHIIEKLGNIQYKIGVKSFFQTNSSQAKRMYDIVKEFGNFQPDETVYDIYCGTGSIALYIADACKKVVGIEQTPEAIDDAKYNAALNHIDHAEFIAGTAESILDENFIALHCRPDKIVVDPPRAGLHEKVVQIILQAEPKAIVYVSCNPATQARDVAMLSEKYKITRCQPMDLFPHTYHIENIVLLERI